MNEFVSRVGVVSGSANHSSLRMQLWNLLGKLPDRAPAVKERQVWERDCGSFLLERITLDLNGVEEVPAYFVRPVGSGPFATILYNHAHGSNYVLGKDELIRGCDALQS